MQTKTITLYEYSELNPKAQKRALNDWRENVDDPFMQSHMINLLKEELDARGFKYDEDSIDVWYSLSHSQGDGFMFIGELYWKKYTVNIKHSESRYCHSNTALITVLEKSGKYAEYPLVATQKTHDEFETMYHAICKTMEAIGYEQIEYTENEESFIETCEANDYTFREDGTMENA